MEGIKPSSAGASMVVIAVNSLQPFDVGLVDDLYELLHLLAVFLFNAKFAFIVSSFPSFLAKFYIVLQQIAHFVLIELLRCLDVHFLVLLV